MHFNQEQIDFFQTNGYLLGPRVLSDEQIKELYRSLRSQIELDSTLATNQVFLIDKLNNQRGRIDDRSEDEIEKGIALHGLYSYNAIKVSEIKNKMSDDIRILFTEYRQKRKGKFDSNNRRIKNLENLETQK